MFAIWVAYGVWQWRRSGKWLDRMSTIPRAKKPSLATLWLLGGAVFLLAALYTVFQAGGFAGGGVATWAWPVCVLAGLAFVHAQAMAGAMLVSMAVTSGPAHPSQKEKEGTSP